MKKSTLSKQKLPIEDENAFDLSGKEYKFLREDADITQKELANGFKHKGRRVVQEIERTQIVRPVWIVGLQNVFLNKFGNAAGSKLWYK